MRVAERLPDFDVPVWLYEDGRAFIGCRFYDSDGWLWARCYGMPYIDARGAWRRIDAEADEDYKPTLWQPLPDIPRYTREELDDAAVKATAMHAAIKVE